MAWAAVKIDEQRIRFAVSASRHEKTMQQLCKEFDISRPTGYEWLRRYQAGGVAGVVEKSRRPHHSPQKTPAEIEEEIVELRQQRPDWGARKLQVLLAEKNIRVPVITVHRILLRRGLVREQDRHRKAVGRFERGKVNQLWQMDFKSPLGWDAAVGPLSVLDDHSRYAIELYGTWCTRAKPVKERLVQAFEDAMVEHEGRIGLDVANGLADETGNSSAFQWLSASANARQGRTISWSAGSSDEATWSSERERTASMAGRISRRIQSRSTA
jgi:transposase